MVDYSGYQSLPTGEGVQRVPTEQPVTDEQLPWWMSDPALSGVNWDQGAKGIADFQKQFMQGDPSKTDAVNKWIAEQAAQGREYVYDPNKDLAYSIAMNSAVPMMSNLGGPTYSNFDPNNPTASMAQIFRFDKEGTNSINAPLAYRSGENYILTDASGKDVLGRAASPEEMQQLVNLADAQKYGWTLYQGDEKGEYTPGAGIFGKPDPRVGGVMGALVNFGLPLALSFVPGLGQLGSAALMGAGSTAGGLMTGKTLGDALTSGAITTATAGLLKGTGLDQTIGNALNNVPVVGDALRGIGSAFAPSTSNAVSKAAADALTNEIVVTAGRSAIPGLAGGLAGSTLANAFTPSVVTNPVTGEMSLVKPTQPPAEQPVGGLTMADPDAIVVTGTPRAAANVAANIAQGGVQGALNTLTQGPTQTRTDYGDKMEPDTTADDPLVVRGIRYGDITAANAARAAAASVTQGALDNVARPEDEIVVTRRNEPAVTGNILASTIANSAPSLNTPTPTTTTPATDAKKSDTLDKVVEGLKLAGLATAFLGGSGGSGSSSATMPGGLGSSNPLYSAKLPTPGVNGAFQVGGMGASGGSLPTPADGDYTRFGMGNAPTRVAPADIPQYGGVNPPGFNTQTWEWLGPQTSAPAVDFAVLPNPDQEPVNKAMGGFAVGGPGDGRSDEIPAMLSDGEYVMDAETVALLGNGSNKAGAKALDKFRANIRKQKGRKLAQGKFSVNAKRPEAYLSGGR